MTNTPDVVVPVDPAAEVVRQTAQDLCAAAVAVVEHGLHQGYFTDLCQPHGAVDARGAINLVTNGNPEDCGPDNGRAERAALALLVHIAIVDGLDYDDTPDTIAPLADWSDRPGQTAEEVAGVMRSAAAALIEEVAQQN